MSGQPGRSCEPTARRLSSWCAATETATGAVLLEAETIAVRIVDRREWDAAHPGVEPTDAVLRDLFADGDLAEDVADAADAEAADGYSPPDDDPEDYEWCLP